jgi:hypothetical protein
VSHDAADTNDNETNDGNDAHVVDNLISSDICSIQLIRSKMPRVLRNCCCPGESNAHGPTP